MSTLGTTEYSVPVIHLLPTGRCRQKTKSEPMLPCNVIVQETPDGEIEIAAMDRIKQIQSPICYP
jgi:hypothetical protein